MAETVFLFQRDTKTWARQRTIGPHPPARLRNGGCCISGQHLYIYGGWDGKSCHGVLYELNTNSWTWKKLCDGGAGGPGKKRGCRMIPYHQDELLVVGGLYDEMPSPRQVGSSYENHRTNEVHCFNLTSGKIILVLRPCLEIYNVYCGGFFLLYLARLIQPSNFISGIASPLPEVLAVSTVHPSSNPEPPVVAAT